MAALVGKPHESILAGRPLRFEPETAHRTLTDCERETSDVRLFESSLLLGDRAVEILERTFHVAYRKDMLVTQQRGNHYTTQVREDPQMSNVNVVLRRSDVLIYTMS